MIIQTSKRLTFGLALGACAIALTTQQPSACAAEPKAMRQEALIAPENVKCEYLENPLGLDNPRPRFSWTLTSATRAQMQRAYQILVGEGEDFLQHPERWVWDSGKVWSDRSVHIEYGGKPLLSGRTYFWAVRVWDGKGEISPFGQAGRFTMGLLRAADWSGARWISAKDEPEYLAALKARRDAEDRAYGAGVDGIYLNSPIWDLYAFEPKLDPAPLLRRRFQIPPGKMIESAMLSICGLGYYELHVNGAKISGTVNPARSDYDKTVYYMTHDVSKYLNAGENVLGVILGHGFYNMIERGTFGESEAPWTGEPKLLLKLHVRYTDGTEAYIVSDDNWKQTESAILWNDVRAGEVYDARNERDGWDKPGFDDGSWQPIHQTPAPKGGMAAQIMPPVRETMTIRPVKVTETSPGVFVYDMGQNFSGWARLKVKGPAGTKVTVSHAEQPQGGEAFIPGEMRRRQQYVCILKGTGEEEIFEPHFNYYAFQYVQVKGFPGTATLDNIEGVVVHTDMKQIGKFECANPLLNRLQTNVLWTLQNIIHGYPQDCPHREKNGWADYNTLAAKSQVWNFDSVLFFEKWMRDCRDQFEKCNGLGVVVPHSRGGGTGDPAWAGAWAVCSWRNYLYYGDKKILKDNYETWKQWVEIIRTKQAKDQGNLIMTGIGDWVAPHTYGRWAPAGPEGPAISSSSYYYHIVDVLANAAGLLGKTQDAVRYRAWADAIKNDFNAQFYNKKTAMYETDEPVGFRQSSQVIPMSFGLVPEQYNAALAKSLDDNIFSKNDGHLDTGTIGTSHLLNVLPRLDNHEAAYSIVSATTYPSWLLHIIKYNATTVWENWNEGGSHNHSCYLSVGAYFYEGLAGIRPDPAAPGFKHVIIRPGLPRSLNSASGAIQSPYGKIRSAWRREGGKVLFDASVPANTWATISVPKDGCAKVLITESGTKVWDGAAFMPVAGLEKATEEADYVTFKAGSGSYRFEVTPVDAAMALGRTLSVEWATTPSPIIGEPGGKVPLVLTLTNRSDKELADAHLELHPPLDCRLDFKSSLGTIPPGESCRVECLLSTPVSANGCRSVPVAGLIRTTTEGKAATIPLMGRLNLLKLVVITGGADKEIKKESVEPVTLVSAENCSGKQQALTLRCRLPLGWKTLKSLPYVPTASSILDNNNRADRLCDHIVNHSTNNRWHSAISAQLPHVITMKLDKPAKVNRLILHSSSPAHSCKQVRLEYLDPKGDWKILREMELKKTEKEFFSTIPTDNVLAQEFRLTILKMEDATNPIAQLNEIEILSEDSSGDVNFERTVLDREMENFELYLDPGKDIGHPRTIALVVDKDGQPYWQGKIQLTGKE